MSQQVLIGPLQCLVRSVTATVTAGSVVSTVIAISAVQVREAYLLFAWLYEAPVCAMSQQLGWLCNNQRD